MDKEKNMYAIYAYDFYQTPPTLLTVADGVDGKENLKHADEELAKVLEQKTIGCLSKKSRVGETIHLPNDLMSSRNGIFVQRVNNSQLKTLWKCSDSKDSQGLDMYEEQKHGSYPYGMVVVDNRPERHLIAIQSSEAWNYKPDSLRDLLQEALNRTFADKGFGIRIDALVCRTNLWNFVRERVHVHGDRVRKMELNFLSPRKKAKDPGKASNAPVVKSIIDTALASEAVGATMVLEFGEDSRDKVSERNEELMNLVTICGENDYDVTVTFTDYKVYRMDDYVKALFPMATKYLLGETDGQGSLYDESDLELWFDHIAELTKDYVNETEADGSGERQDA